MILIFISLTAPTTRSFAQIETPEPLVLNGGIPEGFTLIEGDIIVPEGFYAQNTMSPDAPSGVFGDTRFWLDGIVPFRFDTAGDDAVNVTNQNSMLAAMTVLENVADIDFVQRTTEADFITIRDSTNDTCGDPPEPCPSNSSMVGMTGGEQVINIASWNVRFILVHELMHALGIWHEQSRPDREHYVEINTDNIDPDLSYNFAIREAADVYPKRDYGLSDANTYDFDSVMHYGQCAFAIFTCPPNVTIAVRSPNEAWQNQIGQRNHLSDIDTLTVSFLYSQPNWRFVDSTNSGSQNGSFLSPYRDFTNGVSNTPLGGTLFIQPGNYGSIGTFSNPLTIESPLGNVVIGK